MLEETQALMGATRLASGIFQQPRPASEKCSCYLMELVSILFMFVVLAHFPGSGAASFFLSVCGKCHFICPFLTSFSRDVHVVEYQSFSVFLVHAV